MYCLFAVVCYRLVACRLFDRVVLSALLLLSLSILVLLLLLSLIIISSSSSSSIVRFASGGAGGLGFSALASRPFPRGQITEVYLAIPI